MEQVVGLFTGGAEGAGDAPDPSRTIASERALIQHPSAGLEFARSRMMLIQLKHIDFKSVSVTVDGEQRKVLVIEVQSKGEKTTGRKEFVYVGTERLKAALQELIPAWHPGRSAAHVVLWMPPQRCAFRRGRTSPTVISLI